MSLRSEIQKNDKILMMIGLLLMALSSLWPRDIHIGSNLSMDRIDGIRGFLMGAGIATLLLWVRIFSKQHRQ